MIKRVLGTLCLVATSVCGVNKDEQAVFGKWRAWQLVFDDRPLVVDGYARSRAFRGACSAYLHHKRGLFKPVQAAIADLFLLDQRGRVVGHTKQFEQLRQSMEYDPGQLLHLLAQSSMISAVQHMHECRAPVQETIDLYNAFFRLLLWQDGVKETKEAMFALANRLFEYCYGKGFSTFSGYLNNQTNQQPARAVLSVMWQQLVGEGWRHWHSACLDRLVEAASKHKEIVYIAGGNDVLQLLRALLGEQVPHFTLRIIDPMLDSQEPYYAEQHTWMLAGDGPDHGVGDSIAMRVAGKRVLLTRSSYQQDGTFTAKLSTGQTHELAHSTTTWCVTDGKHVERGQVIFERRFCRQQDFAGGRSRVLLLSFNEMYYVALDSQHGGWGIDLAKLARGLQIQVKQLRKPVSRQTLMNLREAEKAKCDFIYLGSCPT